MKKQFRYTNGHSHSEGCPFFLPFYYKYSVFYFLIIIFFEMEVQHGFKAENNS